MRARFRLVPLTVPPDRRARCTAEKVGAAQHWMAWMVSIGGPGRTFNIVLPINKWSEMDGWTPVEFASAAPGTLARWC